LVLLLFLLFIIILTANKTRIMFGMGQYEKVGDSAKVSEKRLLCLARVFYILSSFFVVVL